jgi:hypothetical protein
MFEFIDFRIRLFIRQNIILISIAIFVIVLIFYIYYYYNNEKFDNPFIGFPTRSLRYAKPIWDLRGYPQPILPKVESTPYNNDERYIITSTPSERVPYNPILGSLAGETLVLPPTNPNIDIATGSSYHVRDVALAPYIGTPVSGPYSTNGNNIDTEIRPIWPLDKDMVLYNQGIPINM